MQAAVVSGNRKEPNEFSPQFAKDESESVSQADGSGII